MKSVVICSSQRFSDEVNQFSARLKKLGVPVVFIPNFKNRKKSFANLDEKDRLASSKSYRDKVPMLAFQHFDRIRRADVCFIFNKDGYLGVNTTLELGFAHGRDMVIYALEPERPGPEGGEPCRDIIFTEVVTTPEELFEKLVMVKRMEEA